MIISDEYCPLPQWLGGSDSTCDVVVSSRVRLARNVDNHRFPRKASLQERKDIFERVAGACRKIPKCRSWTVSNFLSLSSLARKVLVEERLASPELEAAEGDRGVVGDVQRGISIMVNEEDHIRLTAVGPGECARSLYASADAIETALGKKVPFAFDRTRGYLTCCPTNAGTGLRVSYLMHLPGLALTKTVEQVLMGASQTGFSTRGFFGEHSEIVGNFFQLSNQATLGMAEQEFLEMTQTLVAQIADLERQARQRLLSEAPTQLADKIWRSFGILAHARTLTLVEFLNLSSALRLGVDTGILKKLCREDINRITIAVMPAHMQVVMGGEMGEQEMSVARAELLRAVLKGQG